MTNWCILWLSILDLDLTFVFGSAYSLRHHIHTNLGHIVCTLVLSELCFKHIVLFFLLFCRCCFSSFHPSVWWGQTESRILHIHKTNHWSYWYRTETIHESIVWMLGLFYCSPTSLLVSLLAASFSAASPAASFRYLLPTLLSNHFKSTNTSLKCSRSNWREQVNSYNKKF